MSDWILSFLIVILIVAVIAGIIFGLTEWQQWLTYTDCVQISQDSGRKTHVIKATRICYIEIAPGLFVPSSQVIYYLNQVKPVE